MREQGSVADVIEYEGLLDTDKLTEALLRIYVDKAVRLYGTC